MRRGFGADDSPLHYTSFVRGTVPPGLLIIPEHRRRFDAAKGAADAVRWRIESVEDQGEVEAVFHAEVPAADTFALADYAWVHACDRHEDMLSLEPNAQSSAAVQGRSALHATRGGADQGACRPPAVQTDQSPVMSPGNHSSARTRPANAQPPSR